MLMLASNTWPGIIGVVIALCVTAVLMRIFSPAPASKPGVSGQRLDGIEDDLALIRADLADIKESLAELDRLFKSVG